MKRKKSPRPKRISKATKDKWRKDTNACEHDKVGYAALTKLANIMFKRSKEDAWNIEKLSGVLNSQNISLKENKKGISILVDKYEDRVEELEKQVEQLTKQRNEGIRAYNGLNTMANAAEKMGIDLETAGRDLPEAEKNKYDFSQTDTVMESGKVKHVIKLTPKWRNYKPKKKKEKH